MKTRCKVWVNFIPGDDGGEAFNKKGWQALKVAVPFIEYLPGDVVLSREDAEAARYMLEQVGQRTPRGSDDANRITQSLALLRGRR